MTEREQNEVEREEGNRPEADEPTKPGSGDVDQDAIDEGIDKLEQAGGGH
jgi:hypothetical protein